MIMIANKKDKAKMKNDLMLFLNDNTDPFVDWLFDFFEKVNKKENEEARAREPEKVVAKKRHSSEERRKSKSRSPVRRSRSRSPREKRGGRHEDDKPKRAPIRAPTPKRERERTSRRKDERRRRSRSAESDDRRSSNKRRDDRKRITYSDEDDEEPHKTMKSHVVSKIERPPSPKVASQVVVKRRKPDPIDAKAGSSIFKRALTSLRDDEQPLSKQRRRESDVLQVNSLRTSRRTVTQNDDESDLSEDEEEERETQFIVKMGKGAITRKTIRASMDEAPPGDENYAVQHAIAAAEKVNRRKRRADDPVLAFLKLSGAQRTQKGAIDIGNEEAAKRKRKMLVAAAATHGAIPPSSLAKHWNGKIEFDDDDDEEDESDDEAEIDAFLASAHDSRIPPTEVLSRPLQYTVPQKKQFGTSKPPEVGKIAERCKFWPKCRNEETCSYSHPSKPCINFPNCWFGDKCMFIHPQCKFEPNCSKPTCPYTHTLPRPVA
uniref:Zinc finger CCCH domain-containing protein 14 n=1 Tax=Panagrolaimus davidi TaxID=227884 RepID=A0A914PTU5_9BILA